MSQPTYHDWLNIVIDFDLSQEDKQVVHTSVTEMLDKLKPLSVQTDAGPAGKGPGPAEYLATISEIAGAVGGVATAATAIAQAIIAWRHRLQKSEIKAGIKLSAPDKPPLDLNSATDEQIRIYIVEIDFRPHDNR